MILLYLFFAKKEILSSSYQGIIATHLHMDPLLFDLFPIMVDDISLSYQRSASSLVQRIQPSLAHSGTRLL